MIKTVYILLALFLFSCGGKKQDTSDSSGKTDTTIVNTQTANPYAIIDISPMDMSYFPVN